MRTKRSLVRVVPNKTVLFHISENGDVSVYVQRTSHKGAPHTGAKGQGIEIKYMHKAFKWNIMHVQVQRTSLE